MNFNILEILPGLFGIILLTICYLTVRSFFKRIADYTEKSSQSVDNIEEVKKELRDLNNKIQSLEQQLNNSCDGN